MSTGTRRRIKALLQGEENVAALLGRGGGGNDDNKMEEDMESDYYSDDDVRVEVQERLIWEGFMSLDVHEAYRKAMGGGGKAGNDNGNDDNNDYNAIFESAYEAMLQYLCVHLDKDTLPT